MYEYPIEDFLELIPEVYGTVLMRLRVSTTGIPIKAGYNAVFQMVAILSLRYGHSSQKHCLHTVIRAFKGLVHLLDPLAHLRQTVPNGISVEWWLVVLLILSAIGINVFVLLLLSGSCGECRINVAVVLSRFT